MCEIDTNSVCSSNPCNYNNTCIIDKRIERGYKCDCKNLYLGYNCETRKQKVDLNLNMYYALIFHLSITL